MGKRFTACICLLFFIAPGLNAQNLNAENPFRMSVRFAGTVPHPVSNKAFRRSFTGIYDIGASLNFQVFRGILVGIQYQHNLWKIPDNKIPGLKTYGQSHHGGIRVGYDYVINSIAVGYAGVSMLSGRMKFYGISYTPDTTRPPLETSFNYRMIQLEAGVYFYTEGNFAIGVHAAGSFTSFAFDPYKLYLDQHEPYLPADLDGNVSYFNIGFSLVYSFLRKG
ncbi:MAG TPA: hypothetical protein VI731_00060 [Bacteroidia bacterium]|nr:hypothetical protein [Bacteroidia bacterium]